LSASMPRHPSGTSPLRSAMEHRRLCSSSAFVTAVTVTRP
jgi:hypothetical protein